MAKIEIRNYQDLRTAVNATDFSVEEMKSEILNEGPKCEIAVRYTYTCYHGKWKGSQGSQLAFLFDGSKYFRLVFQIRPCVKCDEWSIPSLSLDRPSADRIPAPYSHDGKDRSLTRP